MGADKLLSFVPHLFHVCICHFQNEIKSMLCYVMLCYVMLCYVMLCYVKIVIKVSLNKRWDDSKMILLVLSKSSGTKPLPD